MLVYVNGDSFTAGVGLYDYILPQYPGLFSYNEIESRKKEIKSFMDIKDRYSQKYIRYNDTNVLQPSLEFYDNFEDDSGLIRYHSVNNIFEKKLAYPAQIEKIDSSIKTINAAVPGASITGIVYRTVIDLLEYQAKSKKVDRVVIQLTSAGRNEFFAHTESNLMIDRPFNSFDEEIHQKISKLLVTRYMHEDFMIKYLYTLSMLKQVCISVTGKLPIIIDSHNGTFFDSVISRLSNIIRTLNPSEHDQFEKILEHSMYDIWNKSFMKNIADKLERPLEHDQHYGINVHKLTATGVVNLL